MGHSGSIASVPCGADLVVMGGYRHSRMSEFELGGTTRAMLTSMTVPTLMSH
jgi:nucleotide-binding universal stress UspA family protein